MKPWNTPSDSERVLLKEDIPDIADIKPVNLRLGGGLNRVEETVSKLDTKKEKADGK